MCVCNACLCMYACSSVHELRKYTCAYTHEYWHQRLTPGVFLYFSWFNFMSQNLFLNWQEYRTILPLSSSPFYRGIWELNVLCLCGKHFTTVFIAPVYLFWFYKNMCPLLHLNIVTFKYWKKVKEIGTLKI